MIQLNKVNPWWTNEHTYLTYNKVPFNTPLVVNQWKELGFFLKDHVGYSYIVKKQDHKWIQPFYSMVDGINIEITFFQMLPGDIIPYHSDSYKFYKELYNITNSSKINRMIVFLEDWKAGHILELQEKSITNWKAGNNITWKNDASHMAANLGSEVRYTAQITFTDTQ